MSINALTQTEATTKKITTLKAQTVVECRFAQMDDSGEWLTAYPQVSCGSCEVSSGRVNFSGRLVLFVVYADNTGKLCRMQKGAEFSHYADDDSLTPAQSAQCQIVCQKTQVRRDGDTLVVSVILEATIDIFGEVERTYLVSAEGAICKTDSLAFYSLVPFGGEGVIEDEFDADSVVDILVPTASALVTSCECHDGEVVASGELQLSLLAMRGETPVCLERAVPFRCSVACADASEGSKGQCHVQVRDLSVNATVQEERGKCSVAVSASLYLFGTAEQERNVEAVTDAFAVGCETEGITQSETTILCAEQRMYNQRITGTCAVKSKIDYNCIMKAVVFPQVEFTYSKEGTIEGAVNAVLLYERDGHDLSSEVSLPFSVKLNGLEGEDALLGITVCGVALRQHSEGVCEGEATLKISANIQNQNEVTFLGGITEGQTLSENPNAVSVYLPEKGDSLWKIAKRLHKSPEEVAACNPELNFPLSGNERIVIYRMKTV